MSTLPLTLLLHVNNRVSIRNVIWLFRYELIIIISVQNLFGCFLVFCSFSAFDFQKHGNSNYGSPHNALSAERSSQGKMEKSFLRYEKWSPAFLDIWVALLSLGNISVLFWIKCIPGKMSTAFPWSCKEGSLVWATSTISTFGRPAWIFIWVN